VACELEEGQLRVAEGSGKHPSQAPPSGHAARCAHASCMDLGCCFGGLKGCVVEDNKAAERLHGRGCATYALLSAIACYRKEC
jgi:hypothetical protein